MADGIIHVEVEERLIEVFNALDGFTSTRDDGKWMVVPAGSFDTKQLPNRRLVVIGTPDGAFEVDGMQAGRAPGIDVWTITCGLVCTVIRNPLDAKKACQAALNAMADELARDHRLAMARGPQELTIARVDGPWFAVDKTIPTSWLNFDITASALIRRNTP